MISELEKKLWNAGSGESYEESTWRLIVAALLDDFARFLSTEFERDSDLFVDPQASTFSTWIWSKTAVDSPISVSWSAVLSGSPIGDPNSSDSFAVTIDLFLFHELTRKRIYSSDNLHFLQFAYDRTERENGKWRFLGWQKDEWGEWESLAFPQS